MGHLIHLSSALVDPDRSNSISIINASEEVLVNINGGAEEALNNNDDCSYRMMAWGPVLWNCRERWNELNSRIMFLIKRKEKT